MKQQLLTDGRAYSRILGASHQTKHELSFVFPHSETTRWLELIHELDHLRVIEAKHVMSAVALTRVLERVVHLPAQLSPGLRRH